MTSDSSCMESVVRIGHKPGQVRIPLKGGFCCQQVVREKASCGLEWMCVSSRLASFLFFPRANTPKVNFGASTATSAPGITGGFSFGAPAATSTPSSQAAAPSGFTFGSAATSSSSSAPSGTTGGFTFSSGTTTQAGTAGFGIGAAAPQAAPAAPTFGTAPAAAATTSTATLGAATPSAAPFSLGGQPTGLTFGALPSTAATSTTTATLTTSTSQAPTLSFGSKLGVTSTAATTASTTSTTSVLGSTGPSLFASSSAPASSTSTTGLSLGATSTGSTGTASLGTLGFGLKVPGTTPATTSTATGTTSASGFPLNLKPLTTTGAIGAVTSTAATTTTTTTSAPPVMTYAQLESLINKWSLELEDQEKHFLHQATQVNAWDRMLIENGEKITSLHREVEKVKVDQKRLDQELDFILSQQKELEDLLTPLEESVKEQSGTIYLQHADEERERTYKLAENIDAQLKRMAQDLKDITEHLNTSRGPADTSDPLQQICKILNAHMDSLQWIDQNSAVLQRKVEEVTKVCESRRKEQERSFRITFD
ncbi:PREDICTED: nucleoporin-62 C-terminal-like protein isoform X1 [Ficedula albicollis]|uniref:nucleoporin-62 C-terminal-like protein isoform X1 n=1 Tax=Ficedula albicollis TaxID=59894 RepID=UPI0007AD7ED7|nr:PREDICTED: nucleoporin-62 C-terminal-like protein isoform X1 [Ficedula albicollis]